MFKKNYSGVAKTMINAGWVGEDTKEVELEVVIRTVLDPIFEKPFDEIKFGENEISVSPQSVTSPLKFVL